MSASPIADLSYRGYDGELESPRYRWWVISRMSMRRAFKNKWYWILTAGGGLYPLLIMTIIFFLQQFAEANPAGKRTLDEFVSRIIWKDQFLHTFSFGQLFYLFLALLVGAGSIANDNRANALLVYLSKPCDKTDYLIGKWMGIFLLLVIAMSIPIAFFWFYGALSYRGYGFLSNDPWIVVKCALLIPLMAACYASLTIFFSSFFKQGRVAGASIAGLYFISNFFTKLMAFSWAWSQGLGREFGEGREVSTPVTSLIGRLFYASVDGVNIGAAKAILNAEGSSFFGVVSPIRPVPPPSVYGIIIVILGLCAFCTWVAWKRIRAVEVVS